MVNGVILDAKDNRLLYKTLGAQGERLYIFDRAQNITTNASLPANSKVAAAYLSNFGAVFIAYNVGGASTQQIYDWNGNDLYPLAQTVEANSLKVSGEYAIWSEGVTLVRRNLATLSNSILTTSGGNWQNSVSSIAAWWSTDNQIYVNNGTTTQATNDTLSNYYVSTDGNNIVYIKSTSCCAPSSSHAITLFNGSSEITLREAKSVIPTLGSDYQVRDGWVSYTDIGNQNNTQVWSYNPLGQKVQRTFFAVSSRIDTLGDNGQLMLFSNSKRYLSTEAGPLVEVNSSLGVSYYINDKWYLSLGGIFFSVNTP